MGSRLPQRWADIPIINIFTWIKPLRIADEKNDWGYLRFVGMKKPLVGDLVVFNSPEDNNTLSDTNQKYFIYKNKDKIEININNLKEIKMNKNKLFATMVGVAAMAFTFSLNYRHASNDYGILENTLSVHVQAQSSAGGVVTFFACPRSGVLPNSKCCIWEITYVQGWTGPVVSCKTDLMQSFKCTDGTCPHGN